MTGRFGRRWLIGLLLAAAFFYLTPPTFAAGSRLDLIRERGHLTCGVFPNVAGFASVDKQGRYAGFDVDLCRALSAAIFGAPDRVTFVEVKTVGQFARTPEIDIVTRRLTWTLTREAPSGLMFGPITFYDGQAFLASKSLGLGNLEQMRGRRVCVESGEDWSDNLARYGRSHRLDLKLIVVADRALGERMFFSGQCDAYSADASMLGAIRADAVRPDDYDIPPIRLSREPLAPLIRQGDDQFFEVLRWTVFAMIDAEDHGITSKNIDALRVAHDRDALQYLDAASRASAALGLDKDWAFTVIKSVGDYGEIFARNIGADSPVRLDRGLNALWTKGGLLYAPPFR